MRSFRSREPADREREDRREHRDDRELDTDRQRVPDSATVARNY
jgi:hypothetical protein